MGDIADAIGTLETIQHNIMNEFAIAYAKEFNNTNGNEATFNNVSFREFVRGRINEKQAEALALEMLANRADAVKMD